MNIDRVYVCNVYRVKDSINYDIIDKIDRGDGFSHSKAHHTECETIFVKKALVYSNVLHGYYIDLETKEKYIMGFDGCTKGDLFIYIDKNRIHGKTLMGSNGKHHSKKKILKKYAEYKNGDIHECK